MENAERSLCFSFDDLDKKAAELLVKARQAIFKPAKLNIDLPIRELNENTIAIME